MPFPICKINHLYILLSVYELFIKDCLTKFNKKIDIVHILLLAQTQHEFIGPVVMH